MELLKLIIVDDEPIILEGLVKTYDWESMGYKIVGSAKSGQKALDLIREKKPDIVLTDIRMKQTSGLDVMEIAGEEGFETLFVVLSAYRDFDYAQKALELGAIAYLLKPIEETKLEEVFKDARERCLKARREAVKREQFHSLIDGKGEKIAAISVQKYLDGKLSEKDFVETLDLVGLVKESVYFASLCADVDIALRITEGERSNVARKKLFQMMVKKLKCACSCWEFESMDGHFIVILRGDEASIARMAEDVMEEIADKVGEKIVWGISKPLKGLGGIRESYAEALLRYREAGRIASPALSAGGGENRTYSIASEAQVISAVRKNELKDLKNAFIGFIYELPPEEDAEKQFLHRLMLRVQLMLQESYGLTESLDEKYKNYYENLSHLSAAGSVDICYRLLIDSVKERQLQKKQGKSLKNGTPMEEAAAYIESHLHEEDLSIVEVAEHVYLNSVYFGRVFKNTFDTTFKKYLVERRMERAMRLLDENDVPISVVCEQVGIGDPSYFSRLFKKHTGTLPSAYRKDR